MQDENFQEDFEHSMLSNIHGNKNFLKNFPINSNVIR